MKNPRYNNIDNNGLIYILEMLKSEAQNAVDDANSYTDTSIGNIQTDIENVRDEISTILCVESSQGFVFKNNTVSTILSVVIYHGKTRITDMKKLKEVFGDSAYIQWKWKRTNEESYGVISSNDSRLINDGFSFKVS
ncbi:hypothetical protein, partial [Anaerostipes sp. Marseille-Q3525]|uniref:hypothetical protein n=1 Tax=Anaerostipes sp. Marseille-Q3525 TaxID=2758418 RepID=UPI001BA5E72C